MYLFEWIFSADFDWTKKRAQPELRAFRKSNFELEKGVMKEVSFCESAPRYAETAKNGPTGLVAEGRNSLQAQVTKREFSAFGQG